MRRNGWFEIAHMEKTLHAHSELAEKKEKLIKEFISLKKSHAYIDSTLPYKNEIAKSCIRSSLRYSSEAMEFTKVLVGDILERNPEYSKYYVNMPYILFHLPNDKSEQGNIHNDTIKECQNSITVWTPINTFKNTYPSISIFPRSHSFLINICYRLATKFLPKMQLENLLKKTGIKRVDVYPSISSSYIWDSNLLHMGNLNSSENYHCALVVRISKKPLYYEPSVECKSLDQRTNFESIEFNILELYKNFSKHIESIEKISCESLNIERFISNVYEHRKLIGLETRKALSFALSLVAQRHHDLPNSNYFDLASYIIEKENIVGLERYLNKCSDKKVALKVLEKLSEFESFDTYQEFTLLNKFQQSLNLDTVYPKKSNTIHAW
mgnify:CR=1 FL=1|tara:strand:+ start:604 stop:1749 length:1146 start_codon:yes stop_codon:yes gene_type:complete